MVSTVQQPLSTASAPLLCRMLDKLTAFQALLTEEQDAIRSLSFGQFTSVTVRKTHLLDEIRELEQQRRNASTLPDSYGSPSAHSRKPILSRQSSRRIG
jgi:flagellar biosynthesis/type III secretory pathway chaperone